MQENSDQSENITARFCAFLSVPNINYVELPRGFKPNTLATASEDPNKASYPEHIRTRERLRNEGEKEGVKKAEQEEAAIAADAAAATAARATTTAAAASSTIIKEAASMSEEENLTVEELRYTSSVSVPSEGKGPSVSIESPSNSTPFMPRSSQSSTSSQLGGEARDSRSTSENPPPVQVTAARRDRKAVNAVDPHSLEFVDHKVRALLNNLTMEKFDSISDQIIEWANRSEKEKDGRTLIQVIRLVFDKATDGAAWSKMCARLCRKMMEQISPKVQDDYVKNAEGKPIVGGQLFRKYILNRYQEEFERGWVLTEEAITAAATRALEDRATKAANATSGTGASAVMHGYPIGVYGDRSYAAQKARRRGLGTIKFIGELFKLQILTERIMHECVKKLLGGNTENPKDEELESLCMLLLTVGSSIDTPKARLHVDAYFSRMKELSKNENLSWIVRCALQDVINLRDRKWVAAIQFPAPTTIAGVHEAAAREKANQDKESYQRTMSMPRGGSRRGGDRGVFPGHGADGWTNVASSNTPRPPPKANFGKIANSKGPPMTLGPSSVLAGKNDSSKRESLSRASLNSNLFSMLSQTPDAAAEAKPAPEQRRRPIHRPRTRPPANKGATTEAIPPGPDNFESEEEEAVPRMSNQDADKKIAEDSKEFFAVRNLDEAEVYFSALPAAHHCRLIEKLVGTAVEGKEALAQLVAELLTRVVSKELCSADALEEGFVPLVEILEDIAIDAPRRRTIWP
ncbi:armadillo-type protein [Mycena sanguinolenta]|nr:armadillo-type protein [Mycena sanguinolenta]